jgi:hypothetical protein
MHARATLDNVAAMLALTILWWSKLMALMAPNPF